MLRKTTSVINHLLAFIGIGIHRVERKKEILDGTITTAFGRYSIQIPLLNPLSTYYSDHPDYTGHLGRITSLLNAKYPAMSAIDVGANVGDTACIIKMAADIPIICVEGDPFTFGFLRKNMEQFRDVTTYCLFLGEKSGPISATLDKAGWNTTLLPNDSRDSQSIDVMALDDFLASKPESPSIKLLKIDTEGFDCQIIRGALNFLRALPVVTFEYNRENMDKIGERGIDTLFMLNEIGYRRIAIHDSAGRFLCSTLLSERNLLQDLHDYADGKNGDIYYYDLTVFSSADEDVAMKFIEGERNRRKHPLYS